MKRFGIVSSALVFCLLPVLAGADCPENCEIEGGGRRSTDCLLTWGGVEPRAPGSRVVDCADGDPECDEDGAVDGKCTFSLSVCLATPDPDLPDCDPTGVEISAVRLRGGSVARSLSAALRELLPAGESACTDPVPVEVPLRGQFRPEIGTRRFVLSPGGSSFGVNGLALGPFQGEIVFHAGPTDPQTGVAVVDIVDTSEYLFADLRALAGLVLCLKPMAPVSAAGLLSCGRPAGQVVRAVARGERNGETVVDRDAILLSCRPSASFSAGLVQNHVLGTVGVDGFTEQDCLAAGGLVEGAGAPHPGVCNGPLGVVQPDDRDVSPGAMVIAPLPQLGLQGFPVELSQESALPCGDEGTGISLALAFTTERSFGRVENPNALVGVPPLEFELRGENFSCTDFEREGGPGRLVFAAPQLHLPILGDGITMFTFADR
ncbi:MAG: hypothetical protein KatS3mg076_0609 [Candidatus Binatia bacterium]|nr:MAG: hypothetical protein KatS3mg076_0609 [Candidatus Binatia bacterium]